MKVYSKVTILFCLLGMVLSGCGRHMEKITGKTGKTERVVSSYDFKVGTEPSFQSSQRINNIQEVYTDQESKLNVEVPVENAVLINGLEGDFVIDMEAAFAVTLNISKITVKYNDPDMTADYELRISLIGAEGLVHVADGERAPIIDLGYYIQNGGGESVLVGDTLKIEPEDDATDATEATVIARYETPSKIYHEETIIFQAFLYQARAGNYSATVRIELVEIASI